MVLTRVNWEIDTNKVVLCEQDVPVHVLDDAFDRALDHDLVLLLVPWVQVHKCHCGLLGPFPPVVKTATPRWSENRRDAFLDVPFGEGDDEGPSGFNLFVYISLHSK